MILTRQQSFFTSEYPLSLKLSKAAFISFHFSSKSSTSFANCFEDSVSNKGMTSSARRLVLWTRTWICGRSSHFSYKNKQKLLSGHFVKLKLLWNKVDLLQSCPLVCPRLQVPSPQIHHRSGFELRPSIHWLPPFRSSFLWSYCSHYWAENNQPHWGRGRGGEGRRRRRRGSGERRGERFMMSLRFQIDRRPTASFCILPAMMRRYGIYARVAKRFHDWVQSSFFVF